LNVRVVPLPFAVTNTLFTLFTKPGFPKSISFVFKSIDFVPKSIDFVPTSPDKSFTVLPFVAPYSK
jgi:hypothetical protein